MPNLLRQRQRSTRKGFERETPGLPEQMMCGPETSQSFQAHRNPAEPRDRACSCGRTARQGPSVQ